MVPRRERQFEWELSEIEELNGGGDVLRERNEVAIEGLKISNFMYIYLIFTMEGMKAKRLERES